MNIENKTVKPVFKYIGGKSWLREQLREKVEKQLIAKNIKLYIEPFAGGLGSFLSVYDILIKHKIENVVLNDINAKIIMFYKCLRDTPELLLENFTLLETNFALTIPDEVRKLHITKDKVVLKEKLESANDYFKSCKEKFNTTKNEIEISSILLFLQFHSFNGIYRENSKGLYNTPFNWDYKKIDIELIKSRIFSVRDALKSLNVKLSTGSYEGVIKNKDALYYIDPPYINENNLNENAYSKNGFSLSDQQNLLLLLCDKNYIYSNHKNENLKIIINKENKGITEIEYINRKNIMSSKKESRKDDKIEILVTHTL